MGAKAQRVRKNAVLTRISSINRVAATIAMLLSPSVAMPQAQPVSQCVREWHGLRYSDREISKEQHAQLLKRAQSNDRDAQFRLYRAIRVHGEEVPRPKEERLRWLNLAVANGSIKAQMAGIVEQYGWINKHPDHGARYVALWEQAAMEGDADVAYRLALVHVGVTEDARYSSMREYSVPALSREKYRYWLEVAAERGHWSAAESLCAHHHRGDIEFGFPPAPGEALRWCRLAAQYDCSATAPLLLWEMFREGQGVDKSERIADYWKQVFDERDRRARLRRDPALKDLAK